NTHRHKSFCQVARTNFTHRRSSQPTERFSVNPESQSFPLSGQQIAITHGSYSATIATVGASLRALTFEDRDLITTFPADSGKYPGTPSPPPAGLKGKRPPPDALSGPPPPAGLTSAPSRQKRL